MGCGLIPWFKKLIWAWSNESLSPPTDDESVIRIRRRAITPPIHHGW